MKTKEINKRDIQQMIQRVIEEISMLRKENERLKPLANAYISIQQILDLLPQRSQGYSEDIVWLLKKQSEELNEVEPKVESVVEEVEEVYKPSKKQQL
jgi:DNA repair ATPase RecN